MFQSCAIKPEFWSIVYKISIFLEYLSIKKYFKKNPRHFSSDADLRTRNVKIEEVWKVNIITIHSWDVKTYGYRFILWRIIIEEQSLWFYHVVVFQTPIMCTLLHDVMMNYHI